MPARSSVVIAPTARLVLRETWGRASARALTRTHMAGRKLRHEASLRLRLSSVFHATHGSQRHPYFKYDCPPP